MDTTIGMHIRLTLAAAGICTGCGEFVYAGVYHKCGQPYRRGGPDGEVVAVDPAPSASTEKWYSQPPNVQQTVTRTHCEACGDTLPAHERHVCAGNGRFHS
jgi:hypothetical protein